jgi:predicted glycoside hydrolase/deacetylase ChbG (UPF0249 family)
MMLTELAPGLWTRSVPHRMRDLGLQIGARMNVVRLRSGELVVHPGFPDEGLRDSGDEYGEGRENEQALLDSEDARSWLHLSGFEPSDFRA